MSSTVSQRIIHLVPRKNNDVHIRPHGSQRTVAKLPDNVTGTFTFYINTTDCNVGDELIVVSINQGDLTLVFERTNGIGITDCGRFADGDGGEGNGNFQPDSRWVGHFWFDGTAFINTYDNC